MNGILNIKSNYSLLSSLITLDNLISYAKSNKIKALGLNDDNMFQALDFYEKCISNNIKPILGLNIIINNLSLVCYAMNYKGYQNLLKLTSITCDKELSIEDLLKYKDNLLVIVPFNSISIYKELEKEIVDLYLGYSDLTEAKEEMILSNRIVFFPNRLYFKETEKEILDYLYLIRDGKTIADDINYNIKSLPLNIIYRNNLTNETGLNNIEQIVSICNLTFPKYELMLPIYKPSNNEDPFDYLVKLCIKGLSKRLDNIITDKYKERLKYELSVIKKMGFPNYFLVVYDFIKYAKKNGILVGPGRGSAAGSLVAYSLGITEIDPLKYDLLFERFLNPERVSMPDIDTDFPDIYREQVINYVKEKYGNKRVSGIVTFGTMASKQAIRDVARVLNIPLYKVDNLCKQITTKDKIIDIYNKNKHFKLLVDEDDSLKKVLRIASKIEGFPRHTSSHAAGIVMCQKDLDTIVPLVKSDDMYLTGYTMNHLEKLGLLKMDFLGITNLTVIMNIIDDIKVKENKEIDFNKIPLDDKETISIFTKADTTGIFQFESAGMKNFLSNLKPDSFDDIVAAIALFRPGPAANIDSYIRRKYKQEAITYIDNRLENILKSTNGIIIYQEQIMQIASVVAGYSLGEADVLRRAMSKKKMDVLKSEEPKFINGAINRGYSENIAKEIFDLILRFANYGFNKSHSVAYSVVAFKMAYLKCHYPKYFYANLLTGVIGNEIKTREYITEVKSKGIKILMPDINSSFTNFTPEKDGIRYSLAAIKNVSIATSEDIVKIRGDKIFTDIFDFASRVTSRSLTRKVMETLIDANVFTCFGYNTKTLYYNLDAIMNYIDLAKDLNPEYIMKPVIEEQEEYSKEELLIKEKETFGIYINNHPTSTYIKQDNTIIHLSDIEKYFNKTVNTIILVDNTKTIDTKKGDKMMFIDGSDESGTMDFTLFPRTYEMYKDITRGMIIKVIGNVEKRLDKYQIIANKIIKIS